MRNQNRQSVLFGGLGKKPVHVVFNQPSQSSDGGVILLRSIDEDLGLTKRLAACIEDRRQASKVEHPMVDLLRERVFAIACGYPDGNDARRLAVDPVLKFVCDRSPQEGAPLASQPTLSRFENGVRRRELVAMAYALTDSVIAEERRRRRPKKVRRITIDMDPTDDPTYGNQQLTFFNAYYDNYCYLPMVTSIQFEDETDQHVVAPVLRPGNAKGSLGAIAILKRLVPRVRRAFPKAQIRVRLDGAFSTPEVLDWLDESGLQYAVNMAKNSVLEALAEPLMKQVRARAEASKRTETDYTEARYQAGKWKHDRRVVIKAEVVALEGRPLRDNPRFVINNMPQKPEWLYGYYADRGDAENRLKELHYGLDFDRTSCPSFLANQFRNLLTVTAFVLYQQLRRRAAGTEFARAQVQTLRDSLIKIGVTVVESVRRILIQCPLSFPWKDAWFKIAGACAISTG